MGGNELTLATIFQPISTEEAPLSPDISTKAEELLSEHRETSSESEVTLTKYA